MGKNSPDIDIALDDCSGRDIAYLINDELYPGQDKVGIIKKHNENSKHLETATMFILDTPVDFVNLRTEEYCDDSRIPTVVYLTNN